MDDLPLNDSRWFAIGAAIEQLRDQQTRDIGLATLDLKQAMVSDKLRCMRRNLTSGEGELVPAPFWKTYYIGYRSPSSVTICPQTDIDRHKIDEYGNLVADYVVGWLFYVWKPDFDRLYSGSARDDEPLQPIDRAKAALLAIYSAKAQMPRVLKAATNDVDDYCKKRGWQPVTSTDTVHRAAEQLGYRAPRKKRPPRKRK